MKKHLFLANLLWLGSSCVQNAAPIASNDEALAIAGDSVLVDVLANDTDDQGQLTVFDTSTPANGTVTIEGGSLRYTPDIGFEGSDSFVYRASDAQGRLSTEGVVQVTVNPQLRLTVLHNNNSDGESQVEDAGDGLNDFGGIARFATVVKQAKADALVGDDGINRGVVFLSAGDNFLAGPEFSATFELPNGQPLFDSVAIDLLDYDAVVFGNHEFDFGPDVLATFLVGQQDNTPVLCANLDFSQEPVLQAFVDAGRIVPHLVVTVGGQQVGIVGAMSPDLPFVSSPRGVSVVGQLQDEIQKEIDELKQENVNKIIVLSHLRGLDNDIAAAPQVRDADIWVGGGDGVLMVDPAQEVIPGDIPDVLTYPLLINDAAGRQVPVVMTGDDYKYLGRLVVDFDARGEVIAILPESGPIRVAGGTNPDAVIEDPDLVTQVVGPVEAQLDSLNTTVIGTSIVNLDGVGDTVRSQETNLGDLVSDALLDQAKALAPNFGLPVPNIALQNGGGIRNDSIILGNITASDTFNILPFFNFLTEVPNISASQLKEILENAYSKIDTFDGRFAQVSGIKVTFSLSGSTQVLDESGNVLVPGNKVRDVTLDDGTPLVINGQVVAGAPLVHIVTNNFCAGGGDEYPFRGAPFSTLGVTDQQSLASFIKVRLSGVINNNNYPAAGDGRLTILP